MDATATAVVSAASSAFVAIGPLVTVIAAVVLVSSVVLLFVKLVRQMVGGMR